MDKKHVKARKIDEWSKGFAKLYSIPDSRRRPEEFWNATMAHLSTVGECIRRTNYIELMDAAAHAFCWMCSYVEHCNNTSDKVFAVKHGLSEIVAIKFPNKCGTCQKFPCQCNSTIVDSMRDKSAKYGDLLKAWETYQDSWKNHKLDTWLDEFKELYDNNLHMLTFDNIGFHLLEEAGEEALAVRQLIQYRGISDYKISGIDDSFLEKISYIPNLIPEYAIVMDRLKKRFNVKTDKEVKDRLESTDKSPDAIKLRLLKGKIDFFIELADTFSWFCSVLLKLDEIIQNMELPPDQLERFKIEHALAENYKSNNQKEPLICYKCKKNKCKCVFFPATKKK